MSRQKPPGEGYRFPETPPESPHVHQFPQEYGWPDSPSEIDWRIRTLAMERWMCAKLDVPAERKWDFDCYDHDRTTGETSGFIELKNPLVSTASGKVGRFNLSRPQYRFSDWLGVAILHGDKWRVLGWGVYPMDVVDSIVEKGWHKINKTDFGRTISWREVLQEVDRADYCENPLVTDVRQGINDFY